MAILHHSWAHMLKSQLIPANIHAWTDWINQDRIEVGLHHYIFNEGKTNGSSLVNYGTITFIMVGSYH
jgi:hypothetical protein